MDSYFTSAGPPDPNEHWKTWSYQDMYSCIYYCVLKRSGTRLYTDIMDHINQIYVNLNINIELEEAGHLPSSLEYKTHYSHCIHHVRATKYLVKFHKVLDQFFQVLHDVAGVGFYMDRKLETDIKTDFIKAFVSEVSVAHIKKVVLYVRSHPHAISPNMMSDLNKWLYHLNPQYVQNDLNLFQKMRIDSKIK